MKKTEKLQAAINRLENVSAWDIACDFDKELISNPGCYVAARIDPATGDHRISVEASWCCSADEYFSESGVLSDTTLCSGSYTNSPGPEDGYEWEEDEDGNYWGNFAYEWFLADDIEEQMDLLYPDDECEHCEEFLVKKGWYRFSVGTTPVDQDGLLQRESQIRGAIDELVQSISNRIDELETAYQRLMIQPDSIVKE